MYHISEATRLSEEGSHPGEPSSLETWSSHGSNMTHLCPLSSACCKCICFLANFHCILKLFSEHAFSFFVLSETCMLPEDAVSLAVLLLCGCFLSASYFIHLVPHQPQLPLVIFLVILTSHVQFSHSLTSLS